MSYALVVLTQVGEIVGDDAFGTEQVARACGMSASWVRERVADGLLRASAGEGDVRFDSRSLVRARRLAQLERSFDADPQLAALTADLIEEVVVLRRRLLI